MIKFFCFIFFIFCFSLSVIHCAYFDLTPYEIKALRKALNVSKMEEEKNSYKSSSNPIPSQRHFLNLYEKIKNELDVENYSDKTVENNDYLYKIDSFGKEAEWKKFFQTEDEELQIKRFSYFVKIIYIKAVKIIGQNKLSYGVYLKKIDNYIDKVMDYLNVLDPVYQKIKLVKQLLNKEAKKQVFPYHLDLIERLSKKFKDSFKSHQKKLIEPQSDIVAYIKKGHARLEKIEDAPYRQAKLREFLDEILVYLIHKMRNFLKSTSSDREAAYNQCDQTIRTLLSNLESNKIDNYSSLLRKYRNSAANAFHNEQPRFLLRIIRKSLPLREQNKLKKIDLIDKSTSHKTTVESFEQSSFEFAERYFEKPRTDEIEDEEENYFSSSSDRPLDLWSKDSRKEKNDKKLSNSGKSVVNLYKKKSDGKDKKNLGDELVGSFGNLAKGIIGALGKKIQGSIS